MKRTLLTLAMAVLTAVASYAQGTISFVNGSLTRAQWEDPVTHAMVNVPASANIVYGVLWGRSADNLALNDGALGTSHQIQVSAGIIVAPNPYAIVGAGEGETVFMKIAGWSASFGRDFSAARTAPGAHYGETAIRQIPLAPTQGPGTLIWSISNSQLFQPLRIVIVPGVAFTLTTLTMGAGAVVKNPNAAYHPNGSTVRLNAYAAPGWVFSHWSGDAGGVNNPVDVVMTADKTITAVFVATACPGAPSGLVSWWLAGGNGHDIVSQNHGKLDGGVTFVPGIVGQAFSFDGVASDVLISPSPGLKFTTQFTLEAWIKPTDVENYRQIFSWMAIAPDQSYQLGLAPGGTLRMDISGDGESYQAAISPTGLLASGTWAHVAGTFSNGVMRLYVNGILAQTVSSSISSLYTGTRYNVYIGTTPLGTQRFIGEIDEMSAYNRALAGTEIQNIYNAGISGTCLPPFEITAVSKVGNILTLLWQAQNGMSYRVQYKTNLNATTPWLNAPGDVAATDNTAAKTDLVPANAPQRFYRVELLR